MEKNFVRFINDRSESQRAVIIPDGRKVSFYDENNKWYMNYNTHFVLETGEIVGDDVPLDGNVVSLNWLAGWREDSKFENYQRLKEIECFDSYDIFCGEWRVLSDTRLRKIIKEFKDNGYDVDEKDVRELFDSWHAGWKTGIRNEQRGYHLFCPCGGNPFSVRLSTLHPMCADWQTSYWC